MNITDDHGEKDTTVPLRDRARRRFDIPRRFSKGMLIATLLLGGARTAAASDEYVNYMGCQEYACESNPPYACSCLGGEGFDPVRTNEYRRDPTVNGDEAGHCESTTHDVQFVNLLFAWATFLSHLAQP